MLSPFSLLLSLGHLQSLYFIKGGGPTTVSDSPGPFGQGNQANVGIPVKKQPKTSMQHNFDTGGRAAADLQSL